MTKVLLIIIFFCFAGHVFAQPKDIDGWNKAQWGMSQDEVLRLFEGKEIRIYTSEIENAHTSIEIKMFDIKNDKYIAHFLFDDATKKLIQVNLVPERKNPSETQFAELEQALTEKYGAPSYKRDNRTPDKRLSGGLVLGGDSDLRIAWNFPSTVINLMYNSLRVMDSTISFLFITYRQNKKDALDNL